MQTGRVEGRCLLAVDEARWSWSAPTAKVFASTNAGLRDGGLEAAEDVVGLVAESEQLAANARPATTAERKNDEGMRMGLKTYQLPCEFPVILRTKFS